MKSPPKKRKGEPATDREALWPSELATDAHNDKVIRCEDVINALSGRGDNLTVMLELVQRHYELKERVRELEATLKELRKGIYSFPDASLEVKNFVYRITSKALGGKR